MTGNQWARLLAYVTGLVNQELLLQNEYLAAENRILRTHLPARLRLSDPERCTLAEIGKRLGRKALEKVACVANQTPFSVGTAGWSPGSSTDPNAAGIQAGRVLTPPSKPSSCAWPARTRAGGTTGS
jgi:hypothetical protein